MQGIRRWVAPLAVTLVVVPLLITGCGGGDSRDGEYGDDSDQYENVTP